jgi:hypothetical protein
MRINGIIHFCWLPIEVSNPSMAVQVNLSARPGNLHPNGAPRLLLWLVGNPIWAFALDF